jgi:hypothetical protein
MCPVLPLQPHFTQLSDTADFDTLRCLKFKFVRLDFLTAVAMKTKLISYEEIHVSLALNFLRHSCKYKLTKVPLSAEVKDFNLTFSSEPKHIDLHVEYGSFATLSTIVHVTWSENAFANQRS